MKNNVLLFVSIFIALLLVSGGTYAYWRWVSGENKEIGFNTLASIEPYIVYNEGDSHFVGNFQPSDSHCSDSIYNTISLNKTTDATEMMLVSSIKMDVNAIGTNISNSDSVYWVVNEGTSCASSLSDALAYGTFQKNDNNETLTAGDTLTLTTNQFVSTTSQSYTVYIWIDSSGSNSSLSGETLDVNIWTQIDQVAAWYGDVDFDNVINFTDQMVINNIAGGSRAYSAQQIKNADVNGDGVVDDIDGQLVSRRLSGSRECEGYWPLSPCPIYTITEEE